MSVIEVIEEMKRLPKAEREAVIHYFDKEQESEKRESMSVNDAIDHVFENYDGLLAKLAQ